MSTASEFGRGKTIFVLAIVIGCFAVLWPKIFYPMLTASISQTQGDNAGSVCCDVISLKDTNAYEVMNEICANIMRKEQMVQQQEEPRKKTPPVKVSTASLCRNEIKQTCGVDIIGLLKEDHSITMEYKKSLVQLRSFNTSYCIKLNYGVDVREIGLPRKFKGPESAPSHMRPERPFRPGPDMVHPALRERGRAIPTVNIPRRTIEREARPGPVPGMRPPVGGAGHIPSAPKGGGTMGIIMPMYTIGIVCFFLYTIMKILFKKNPEAEQLPPKPAPVVKDYGMDPEHRKFVMSEEYAEGSDRSLKEAFSKEDRDLGLRRRPSGGKSSARFYEDRRRLDLETDPETTTTSPLTPPDNMPESSTLAPATTEPVTETVDEVVKDDDITIPSTSTPFQRHIEENADTQIQNVTNEPESEPEPLKDQMAYEKLDDENESIIPYSSPLQDESSLPPTLHDIGIALVHDVVTEAQKFADSIKEIAEIPVATEDDKTATSADTAGETMQNESEIPLSVVEELKTTPPLPLADSDGEVKPESSKRHELSKEVSVCSSADTVIAESVTGSEDDVDENAIESVVSSLSMAGENVVVAIPKESNVAEEISRSEEPELVAEAEPHPIVEEPVITTTKMVEQAAPPAPRSSEPEIGPLSPLAPEQTPDIEAEPSHFFDRTIVIADYEPEAARARKQSLQLAQEAAAQEAPLPSAPTEPVSEPEAITIVKQDSVPPQVLSLAEKIAARILDAAKSDLAYVAAIAQGESMIALDDHKDTAAAITIDEPTPESEPTITSQPRLSLDTNLPLPSTNQLETADATATDADNAANSELFVSSDNLDTTKISSTPKAPATTPEIQVETPHADQTEMNRIAEFLEGLNTEPKEAEKLAAIPQEQPEIGQNAPIVTLADESKDSFSDSPKASQTIKTKSKLEITPIDDSQVGASSSSTIADICYVTQPLDDSQKGVDKSKILKSAVEIVSFDEGLVVASEHMEKVRKSSEPMNIGLIDPKSTETLEEAVKKLRHVMPKEQPDSGEGTGSESDKLKKTKRKSSTAQSEDSTKESEIDKYVERMANLQGSRKAMIEQAMFKSSTSSQSQGSEPEQQAADQSSNFHGPGLLDSGQSRDLPEEKIDKMKEVEKWATANINDDSKNDDDNDGKTPDVLVDIINDASLPKLEKVDVDDIDINIAVPSHEPDEEPGTESIPLENETVVVVPQEIIDKVNIFIDQAIQDGIKEAVKMLQNIGEQKNISVVESSIPEKVELGKLDEVLEELGQSSSNIILSSVPTMEPKGEKDRSGLELEPLEKEEGLVFDNNSILEEANVARDTNEPVQTDNETVSHAQTQPIISTTCDNTNLQPELLLILDNVVTQRVDGDDGQVDTKGIASDSAEKVTSLTVVKNTDDVQIADEPESISATAVEASPIEIETTIPSESLPSDSTITTIPPVEVESTETVTVLSSPQEETEEKVGDEQQEVGNEEESEENQEEDSQEIIAELETIQEEIESLSTELDQMENAAVAASAAKEEERERLALSNQERQVQQTTEAVLPPQVEETPSAEVAPTAEKQSTEAETDAQKEVISEVKEDSEAQQTPQVTGSQILQETAQVEESTTSLLDEIEKVAETPQTGESTKQEEPATVVPPSNDTIKSEISPQTEESSEPTGPVGVEELKSQATAVVGEVPQIEEKIETVAAQQTSEIPKPGETPQVTETPKLEETPEVPDTPKPDETPQVTETPKLEETPEVPDTPKPDETPQVPEPPKPEETPEVTQTPKSEETPEVPETPKPEETPEVPEPLKPEKTPQVPEPPKPEETPQVPEPPKPEVTQTPKSEETPEVPETPKSEETPEVPEPLKPEETPEVTQTPKSEETPEVPETPKSEDTPEVPKIPKSGETPEVPEPPKSEEIPEVPETPKIEDVLQTAEAPKPDEVTPAPEPEGIVQALEIPKEEEVSPPSTAVQEEILQVSVLPTAEDSAPLQTIPKPDVTDEPTTVTPLIEEKTLAISISAIGTEQQLSLVEIPNTEELPQITEASQSAQSSQIEDASTLKQNETPQNIESSVPADTEQPAVDPVKTEETISVITSSQPLSSPALPKDDIIIPSEKQTIQSQEESQISSSPIQLPADVIQQQPDAASEPGVQTEYIAQPPKEQVPQPPLSQDVPPTQQISQADTVQQEQESLSASVPDEQKPEVMSLTSIDVSQSSTILPTDSTQTNTLPSAVSLHFETLSEPPFPIPPTSTPQNQYISDTSKLADSDTITASCGVVESSSLLSSASVPGLPMALTVELLDENSPEIFPLPSTQSMSTTSPVEKVQDQDINVIVGVPLTEQASSSVDTDDAAADQRATEASSATTTADATTTTTIDVVTPSTSTDQVSSAEIVDELEVPTSPAPPPTPAAHALNEPPSFPVLSAEVSKQLEQEPESMPQVPTTEAPAVVVVVEEKEAQPQQVEVKDDDGQKANRESVVTAVKGIVEAFDAPIVPALSSPFVAPSRSSTTKGTQEAVSQPSQTIPPLQPQLVEEDLEKLISGGIEATKKEDLAGVAAQEKQEAQPLKPATRERKSSEKEVKFKLPPEEMEDDEEELEGEVEIVRPPTPPKTLSKNKPKSPEPTPEPTVNVPTSSSHRDHDELLISSMQTTVTGTSAPGITADNKSCSAAAADTTTPTYNIASKVTPPRTVTPPPRQLLQKLDNSKDQFENLVEQSAAAAIAAAKAAGSSSPSPSERVSVVGIEETASLISGERWDNRTPTPTFRQPTPPVPHRPPSPPEQIPSIYLEGPMPVRGQEIVVREAQIEVEGGEDYELDDEYEPSAPVVLSGKVTLSVISSMAGGPLAPDEITEASSLSLDDRAQAENSRGSSRRNLAAEISNAMNEEVKGKTDGKKSSNASSPDMDEYEVIGKGGFECEEDVAADVSLDDYLTATDAELDADKAHDDTAADISTIDDLKADPLPQDEE